MNDLTVADVGADRPWYNSGRSRAEEGKDSSQKSLCVACTTAVPSVRISCANVLHVYDMCRQSLAPTLEKDGDSNVSAAEVPPSRAKILRIQSKKRDCSDENFSTLSIV